jgi:hypothetical protein
MIKQAREDTECAIEIWMEILPNFFGFRLDFIIKQFSNRLIDFLDAIFFWGFARSSN